MAGLERIIRGEFDESQTDVGRTKVAAMVELSLAMLQQRWRCSLQHYCCCDFTVVVALLLQRSCCRGVVVGAALLLVWRCCWCGVAAAMLLSERATALLQRAAALLLRHCWCSALRCCYFNGAVALLLQRWRYGAAVEIFICFFSTR